MTPVFTFAGREARRALGKVFERFANGSPLTVLPRGTLEYALRPGLLGQLFAATARRQYTHQLPRDGDTGPHILTNIPPGDADALVIAGLYRGRWAIGAAFGES